MQINCRLKSKANRSLLSSVVLWSLWSVLVDQLLDVEVSDEGFDNWVFPLDVGNLDLGLLWDEIHLSFSFLFLELEGDSSDWSFFDSLHHVSGETSNLVSHSLGLNNGDIVDDSLVEVEVLGKLSVVLLDDGS